MSSRIRVRGGCATEHEYAATRPATGRVSSPPGKQHLQHRQSAQNVWKVTICQTRRGSLFTLCSNLPRNPPTCCLLLLPSLHPFIHPLSPSRGVRKEASSSFLRPISLQRKLFYCQHLIRHLVLATADAIRAVIVLEFLLFTTFVLLRTRPLTGLPLIHLLAFPTFQRCDTPGARLKSYFLRLLDIASLFSYTYSRNPQ